MASDVFSFLWTVPETGYKWIQVKTFVAKGGAEQGAVGNDSRLSEKPEWVLTDGLALGQGFLMKQYSPLRSYSGLFRTFAGLRFDDRDAILAFANQYGNLGIGRPLDITAADNPQRLLGVWGETWLDWKHEIDAMRRAIIIWDMVQAGDATGLSRYICWEDAQYLPDGKTPRIVEGWMYDSHPDLPPFNVDARRASPPPPGRTTQWIQPVLDLFKHGNDITDVIVPASFLVQRWINDHLKGKAAPLLVYHLELGKRVLQIIPNNLLSAMWLQFAQSIDGNRKYRACKECGRWFEISSGRKAFRINRLFCSDACKSRDYRRRREQVAATQTRKKSKKPARR